MNDSISDELANWVPLKLTGSFCNWLYLGNEKFIDPFFSDTISVCKKLSENRNAHKVLSDLDVITEWSDNITALNPSVIIFHVSRCGSTLLSQLLSIDETNIVLSEVPIFDELLRMRYKNSVDIKIINTYLISAVKFYGQKRNGKEQHLIIKTDSWHLHFYNQLRSLFPSVPFILLYRNPKEVIASHQKQRGMQSVPGLIEPEIFNFSKEKLNETNLDAYMTSVLESYFKRIIEIVKTGDDVLLCNYNEGMINVIRKASDYIGLNFSTETEKLIYERLRFNAKHPHQLFKEDYKKNDVIRSLTPLMDLYNELEEMRTTMP